MFNVIVFIRVFSVQDHICCFRSLKASVGYVTFIRNLLCGLRKINFLNYWNEYAIVWKEI